MKSVIEVFWRFLLLGCISFGGPAAHIGYFRSTFVEKLNWLDDGAYARLVALSQFLPGPGSSQIGFAIGCRQAGVAGGLAAFIGFTLPSFVLLTLLAIFTFNQADASSLDGIIHGLKLLAVVVVADACLGMYKNFCQERFSTSIAVATAAALLLLPGLWTQALVLVMAAGIGVLLSGNTSLIKRAPSEIANTNLGLKQLMNSKALWLFALLFLVLPLLSLFGALFTELDLFSRFYQAGSLVFGGGHVVLPLLQQLVGESLGADRFLSGYAAAQAVPGPMFTLAAFLGANLLADSPWLGALLATLGVFLPGLLLVLALQRHWEVLASKPKMAGAIWGINAAVVGLLLSALYLPVFSSAVLSGFDMALVLMGFYCLKVLRCPLILLVALFIACGFIFV